MTPRIHAPSAIPQIKSILQDYFEKKIKAGVTFREGEIIRFGWFFFKVMGTDDDGLEIYGPDLRAFPMEWERDISLPLNLALVQKYVPESYNLKAEAANLDQNAIVSKSFGTRTDYFLNRVEPANEKQSGWFVGFLDDPLDMSDASNLTSMSLYELSLKIPDSVRFWLLPANIQVLNPGDNAIILENFKELEPEKDSYMWRLQNPK